jgi:hypothetical protein
VENVIQVHSVLVVCRALLKIVELGVRFDFEIKLLLSLLNHQCQLVYGNVGLNHSRTDGFGYLENLMSVNHQPPLEANLAGAAVVIKVFDSRKTVLKLVANRESVKLAKVEVSSREVNENRQTIIST